MIKRGSDARAGGPSRKRNLFSHVVEEIGRRIVGGEFEPGSTLPNEALLGKELDASRSVIREAVKSLAAKGLIESRTRTGIRVLAPKHWNLLDPQLLAWRYQAMPPSQFYREIFEVRSLIEPQAAALAASRATRAEVSEIVAACEAMPASGVPADEAIAADLRFHHAILAGAHNDLLLQMGNLIGAGLEVSHRLSSETYSIFLPLHRKVADAILSRDAAAARNSMTRLLADTHAFLDRQVRRSRQGLKRSRGRVPASVAP